MIKMLRICFLLLIFISISCEKDDPTFPIEPSIEFNDIRVLPGIDIFGNQIYDLTLYLEYSDGDANLGRKLVTNDDNNCTVTSFKKLNGQYTLIRDLENPWYLTIPEIPNPKKTYQRGPLTIHTKTIFNGDMEIRIGFLPQFAPFKQGDTLKITVQIRDNDNNYSNLAEREYVYPL